MASENLDQMLQMARSHDIGLVLCNQSLGDLYANSPKVFHAVNGNCGIRQWFSATANSDIDLLQQLMGTMEEIQVTHTTGGKENTRSYRTEHVPRARVTDIHTVSENPNLSFLQIGGSGRGYARYQGIPFVCFNDYHISAEEYTQRRNMPWPSNLPGMFETKEVSQADPFIASPKPKAEKRNPRFPDNFDARGDDPQDLFS